MEFGWIQRERCEAIVRDIGATVKSLSLGYLSLRDGRDFSAGRLRPTQVQRFPQLGAGRELQSVRCPSMVGDNRSVPAIDNSVPFRMFAAEN